MPFLLRTACKCWNRYAANNEIISDEPAMHDENLNARSFAKRGVCSRDEASLAGVLTHPPASPRTDRLPTMYGKGVFCHTCQTNQMLLSNLLSNYIPPVDVSSPFHAHVSSSHHTHTIPDLLYSRIQNIPEDYSHFPHTENQSKFDTHLFARNVSLSSTKKSGNEIKWHARAPWAHS